MDDRGSRSPIEETPAGHELYFLESIREIDASAWNDVVRRSRCGTVFHHAEWIRAIEAGVGRAGHHLVVTKETNPIAVFPNVIRRNARDEAELVSIDPGFGGPLVTTDEDTVLSLMMSGLEDTSERIRRHRIDVCHSNFLRYSDVLRSSDFELDRVKGRFVLPLHRGYREIRENMSRSRRRGIERGEEAIDGVVEEQITLDSLRRFAERYETHMRELDVEPFPTAFFEQLLPMGANVLLLTLRIEGEYAGGFMDLIDEERSAVHAFFAGIPREYNEYHASELLYDRAIRWAIEHGYETYDFGGGSGDFSDGLFRFKQEFGGELAPNLRWQRSPNRSSLLDSARHRLGRVLPT